MADFPISFTGSMVRAVLRDVCPKDHTRRVMRPQPTVNDTGRVEWKGITWLLWRRMPALSSPYGKPGDLLWVRERQRVIEIKHGRDITDEGTCAIRVRYEADGAESDWLPYPDRLKGQPAVGKCLAYGGYRESSRLTLVNRAIAVERLQGITSAGARREGLTRLSKDDGRTWKYGIPDRDGWPGTDDDGWAWADWDTSPVAAFRRLWDSINHRRGFGWETNPWVWTVSFERQERA